MPTRRNIGSGTAGPSKSAFDTHPYQFACRVDGCMMKRAMPTLSSRVPQCRIHPDVYMSWYCWPGKDNGQQPPKVGRS